MFIGINSAQSDPVLVVSFDGLTFSTLLLLRLGHQLSGLRV